jgi:hypothetical protein
MWDAIWWHFFDLQRRQSIYSLVIWCDFLGHVTPAFNRRYARSTARLQALPTPMRSSPASSHRRTHRVSSVQVIGPLCTSGLRREPLCKKIV